MALFKCCVLIGKRKKTTVKGDEESSNIIIYKEDLKPLMKVEQPIRSLETYSLKENSSMCKVKVMSHESPVERGEATEEVYEGEDEKEENSIKRDLSDSNLVSESGEQVLQSENNKIDFPSSLDDVAKGIDRIQSGHISDPGIEKAEFWASPKLKRSCSNLETRNAQNKSGNNGLPPSKCQSFEELQELAARLEEDVGNPGSPQSVMTHQSADRVMLKKHSSSQILPSRSRKLWWKLFLWSHRNLQIPLTSNPRLDCLLENKQGGYCSDTLEPDRLTELSKTESPESFAGKLRKNGFHGGVSGLWPQNQWVAFSAESSSFNRVDEWVKDLETQPPLLGDGDEGIVFPPSPETGKSPARSTTHLTRHANLSEEILHAQNVIQSLNSSSTVAHISGTGLKIIPSISCFSSLRTVNLSSNLIVHITPGSLPKGLHTLNLSRNKISTIEGLRDLTRLRVLDLSYNRISRIGHGLSNCALIKELYLAGNKISDVEGLHRLLKLTVLDLSFNKITTTKALGQLVANYNSLLALNLLGNPIQSNINDDQLRKAVCSLLSKLAYLNKQPIKPQCAREVVMDSVAKAALGNGSSSRRRAVKKVSLGKSLSLREQRSTVRQKSRNRTKSSRSQDPSSLKMSSGIASSSR